MKILYLSQCVPFPPDKGDKVRAFHQIRCLSQQHKIHLVAVAKTAQDLQYRDELFQWCDAVDLFPLHRYQAGLRAGLSLLSRSTPLTHGYFFNPRFAHRVSELCATETPDVVFAYTAAMAPYAAACRASARRLLDLVDMDSDKWQQYAQHRRWPFDWIFRLESKRLRAYEAKVGQAFDEVLVTTERERQSLLDLELETDPRVLRNGSDMDYFKPLDLPADPQPRLVFTGQMDYFPNEDAVDRFARKIFPKLKKDHPELSFDIVGRNPTDRVLRLADIQGIQVTGEVEDIRPYLERSWVFVAPLRIARGVQNKVLEAVAMNRPVVCSEEVYEGLQDGGFQHESSLLVARSDSDLIQMVSRLIDDAELRQTLARRAATILEEAYSWDENMRGLEALLSADQTTVVSSLQSRSQTQ